MSRICVTTLVENNIARGGLPLMAEHGLSFFIETGRSTILFDSGQGLTIENNAARLGRDLSAIDTMVLSHGHYDHGGGLRQVLKKNDRFTLVAHPDVYSRKFVDRNGRLFPIGIEAEMEQVKKSRVKLEIGAEPFEIEPGVMTTGVIPLESEFEEVEPMFFTDKDQSVTPDLIEDDKALILDTPKGIVVVLGCAHRGIINILNHVKQLSGKDKIYAIMGGLHLLNAGPEKLEKICTCFHDFHIEKFIVGHCTGFQATAALLAEFKEKVLPNTVGHVAEF